MPLTCYCETDYEDYDWFYIAPSDFSQFSGTRRKRCSSCNELINIGEDVAAFSCYRPPRTFVEERIYGEGGEVPIADKYLCESCAGIYFSLRELGFECVAPDENMRELAKEHRDTYS